ncbi:Hint domain-containing protein [Sedimentitalea todarodis]|uniref:Hint domain-containing protein n=1 Tax=Sedimentitalea todarodis TaxID=1631240 RepID=A0ABU3VJ29_9RHOB|nr:Hint domain-containing protein [Sedimentitalea todarodis]MDU9006118.1 Hint domain-containing protein [Sedimentitalea todarodis]
MATTFNVISLGRTADLDTVEGNSTAEGASDLVGTSFGSDTDPLCHQVQILSPGNTGFRSGVSNVYDLDNSPSETFRIDGGPEQVFDGTAIFGATLTYTDGTTAQISAVLFQDTSGNTYLAPEFSANADQRALVAKPIQSLNLDSVERDFLLSGLTGDREVDSFMVCFSQGTQIDTPSGPVPVEHLRVGDAVSSIDGGPRAIRWIGSRVVSATPSMRSVRIKAGALGSGLPFRDLHVSQQHRILARSRIAKRMFGQGEILVAAKKLVGLPGIDLVFEQPLITYWHILCNRHEIVFAEGAPAETLFTGKEASVALGQRTVRDIKAKCPDLAFRFAGDIPARLLPSPKEQKVFARRLLKNGKSVLELGLSRSLISSGPNAPEEHPGRVAALTRSEPVSDFGPQTSQWLFLGVTPISTCQTSASQRA